MSEILIGIGKVILWLLFINLGVFVRVIFLDMKRLIDGEKYFTTWVIIFHLMMTLLGLIFIVIQSSWFW
jgi:hypothetical protein